MKRVIVTLFGPMFEQQFYEISDDNSGIVQGLIDSKKTKNEVDSIASGFRLVETIRYFETDKTRVTIQIDGKQLTSEPFFVTDDLFFNQTYASIDCSTYFEPITINSSSRVFSSNPEQWLYFTQRVFDHSQKEQFFSPLNSLLLKSELNGRLHEKEYLIKSINFFAVYQYEFTVVTDFDIDKLSVIIDPNTNFHNDIDNTIPDFVLYDEIFCGGEEVYSIMLNWDWVKGEVGATEIKLNHSFQPNEESANEEIDSANEEIDSDCDIFTTVSF